MAVSSLVEVLTALVVGASFTAATVTVTVAVLLSTVPSFVLKVKVAGPSQLVDGGEVTPVQLPHPNDPLEGLLTIE